MGDFSFSMFLPEIYRYVVDDKLVYVSYLFFFFFHGRLTFEFRVNCVKCENLFSTKKTRRKYFGISQNLFSETRKTLYKSKFYAILHTVIYI